MGNFQNCDTHTKLQALLHIAIDHNVIIIVPFSSLPVNDIVCLWLPTYELYPELVERRQIFTFVFAFSLDSLNRAFNVADDTISEDRRLSERRHTCWVISSPVKPCSVLEARMDVGKLITIHGVASEKMLQWTVNGKGYAGKWPWPNLRYYPGICVEEMNEMHGIPRPD
jgi:hypothetical protein